MFTSRRKENLIKILSELAGNDKGNSNKQKTGITHTDTTATLVKSINITIEIPQLNTLIQEIRELKETLQEFFNLIKSRIEQQEELQEDQNTEQDNQR